MLPIWRHRYGSTLVQVRCCGLASFKTPIYSVSPMGPWIKTACLSLQLNKNYFCDFFMFLHSTWRFVPFSVAWCTEEGPTIWNIIYGCRTKLSAAMYSQRNSLYLTWLRTVGDVPPFTLPAITVTTILVPYLQVKSLCAVHFMMTSSIWDIFRVTSPLRGEFTVHRWIHLAKASDAELWCFLWSAPQQTVE